MYAVGLTRPKLQWFHRVGNEKENSVATDSPVPVDRRSIGSRSDDRRFTIDFGMIVLTGATDADHMRTDLDIFNFNLKKEEVESIEGLAAP